MKRVILHCDMNSYYASVEAIYNPNLIGKEFAVCGKREDRHGIVLAKSQKAKEKGVKTGEAIWKAQKKCRNLIIVEPNYKRYIKYSKLARDIYCDYTDKVESYGIDECWLDITNSIKLFGEPFDIAFEIKERIKKELSLTCSIGISFNKVFSKLGSDLKKPDAITIIKPSDFKEKIYHIDVGMLFFVGRKSKEKLLKYGIKTIGDLADSEKNFLQNIFGKNGIMLYEWANGRDNSRVKPEYIKRKAKSIGQGITTNKDLYSEDDVKKVFLELSQGVSKRLRKTKVKAKKIQITIKKSNLTSFSIQSSLDFNTQNSIEIANKAFEIFSENYIWDIPVRALTIRAIDLIDENSPEQITFLSDYNKHNKLEKLDKTIMEIREKYGKDIITFATLLGDIKIDKRFIGVMTLPEASYR